MVADNGFNFGDGSESGIFGGAGIKENDHDRFIFTIFGIEDII